MSATDQVKAVNERIKAAQYPVTLLLRGKKLALRATLPPKPHSDRTHAYQQTISLGLPSNPLGIQQAEAEAIRLGTELITGAFSWKRYSSYSREPLHSLIRRFEQYHRSRNKISDYTWKKHYMDFYRRLPQAAPLSLDTIMPLILSKPPHTRVRKQACRQLQKLCDFAELDADLLRYQGTYNSSTSVEREIPLDEDIAAAFERIKNPLWRWVFGAMATYGLRDHECWFCEFNEDGDLQVLSGKTGPRLIELPLYPEWVDEWNLRDLRRPDLNVSAGHNYLAEKCGKAFRRYNIGFTPYTLRYAYGHRGSVTFGYESPIMAVQMGHSLDVHIRTYQRFINAALVKRKVAEMKARANLPKAPKLS